MPITLTKIASNTAKTTVKYGEDEINIVYLPAKITEKTFAELQTFESMKSSSDVFEGFESLNSMLAQLIKSWDIFEDEKQTEMFPTDDVERLKELPIMLRAQILYAIMGDFRPE